MGTDLQDDLCSQLEALVNNVPGVRRADVIERAWSVKTHTGHFSERARRLLQQAGLSSIIESDVKDGEFVGELPDQAAEFAGK